MKSIRALSRLHTRSFWGRTQARLVDNETELKIDRYRGQIEDFVQNFDKFEEYLADS